MGAIHLPNSNSHMAAGAATSHHSRTTVTYVSLRISISIASNGRYSKDPHQTREAMGITKERLRVDQTVVRLSMADQVSRCAS